MPKPGSRSKTQLILPFRPLTPRDSRPDDPHVLCQVARTVIERPDVLILGGIRGMVGGLTVEVPGIPPTTLDQLGYGRSKIPQLMRNYWNEKEAERVRAILAKRGTRDFTSVAMMMRNGEKDSRSMGWCMLSLVITRAKKQPTVVTVQYRSTELTMKFGGDLVFLPTVFERIGIKPDVVRFQFANAFLSGVYFPYLGVFWPGGMIPFLEYLEDKNPELFLVSSFLFRSACDVNHVFPYSPEARAHKFAWQRHDMRAVRVYLGARYKALGKDYYIDRYFKADPQGEDDGE